MYVASDHLVCRELDILILQWSVRMVSLIFDMVPDQKGDLEYCGDY